MDEAAKQTGTHAATVLLSSDDVLICVDKVAGEDTFKHEFRASSTMAALNAVGYVIVDFANLLKVSPAEVLASLTVTLLGDAADTAEG